jgi:site-specific DNA recombinase
MIASVENSRRRKTPPHPKPSTIGCAIYTRKSTDEGLNQEFNSLDAQRESAEAFIASQQHEGWRCLSDRYDDGGYSGGNVERPALQRLLTDVRAGKVNCIVVYKVDRLSRSLLDFAKIMELLDKQGVSFVSVTQQFNTTHSMGRLTLNILLSFAQFEREIIAERTRDKMAAARRKGKWVGGAPILGYDVDYKVGRLVVNELEAQHVREIFQLYLERQSLTATVVELNRQSVRRKEWISKDGRTCGGGPWTKSNLLGLLQNVTYIGQVNYKDNLFPGEQTAIVDENIWSQSQELLRRNGSNGGKVVRNKYGSLLRDILCCGSCNAAMIHGYTSKGNRRYRYYTCLKATKQGWETCATKSVPAHEIETFVVAKIRAIGQDPKLLTEVAKQTREIQAKRESSLRADQRALRRERQGYIAQMKEAVTKGNATSRLHALEDQIQASEQRSAEIQRELDGLEQSKMSEAEIAHALAQFDLVWQSLNPKEQARLLHLLIERVSYNRTTGRVAITFRNNGIWTLHQESLS